MTDSTDTGQAPEAGGGEPGGSTRSSVFEKRKWMKADGVGETLAERLGKALRDSVDGTRSLVLCGLVQPVGVRAATPSPAVTPARLVLPEGAAERLGADLETHLTVGAGEIRLWLAHLERVPRGSTVTLVAVGEDGEIVETSVAVEDDRSPIRLSIPWNAAEPPEAIALGFDL